MSKSKTAILAFVLSCIGGTAALAQVPTAPIVIRQRTKPKQVWVKGVVVHADPQGIVLSDPANPRMIRTYTLAPHAHNQMEKIVSEGGYHAGDRVKIRCAKGDTVAVAIKGRPSRTS